MQLVASSCWLLAFVIRLCERSSLKAFGIEEFLRDLRVFFPDLRMDFRELRASFRDLTSHFRDLRGEFRDLRSREPARHRAGGEDTRMHFADETIKPIFNIQLSKNSITLSPRRSINIIVAILLMSREKQRKFGVEFSRWMRWTGMDEVDWVDEVDRR